LREIQLDILQKKNWNGIITYQSFPTHRTSIYLSCEQHLEDSAERAHDDNLARKRKKSVKTDMNCRKAQTNVIKKVLILLISALPTANQ